MKVATLLMIALNVGTVYTKDPVSVESHKATNDSHFTPSAKFYSGKEAKVRQFPFMILMMLNNQLCTASYVKPYWAITTAHCIPKIFEPSILMSGHVNYEAYLELRHSKESTVKEILKSMSVQERKVNKVHIHPSYKRNLFYDVALLELSSPFHEPDVKIMPISTEKMDKLTKCTVLGFGMSEMQNRFRLYYSELFALPAELGCSTLDSGPVLCLRTSDPSLCPGDLGSPLICDNKMWGVFSSIYNPKQELCADFSEIELYYTELHSVLPWIEELIGKNSSSLVIFENKFLLTLLFIFLRNFLCIFKL